MKFVVDRIRWLRGEGAHLSYLLREKDKRMCCLGFLGQSCSLTDDEMLGKQSPGHLETQEQKNKFPKFLFDYDTSISWNGIALMEINDDASLLDAEREYRIAEIFAKHDIQVEFVN